MSSTTHSIDSEIMEDFLKTIGSTYRDQLSHAIISNVKAIVEAKQYLFETLWNIASPAEHVIREIELGTEPTKTEIIQDTKVSISRSL